MAEAPSWAGFASASGLWTRSVPDELDRHVVPAALVQRQSDQIGGRFLHRPLVTEHVFDLGVRHVATQPIGAQQERIAGLELVALEVDLDGLRAADRALQHARLRMTGGLLGFSIPAWTIRWTIVWSVVSCDSDPLR